MQTFVNYVIKIQAEGLLQYQKTSWANYDELWVTYSIERLHFHSNENRHKNNHGYSVESAILLYKFQCTSYNKSFKTPI